MRPELRMRNTWAGLAAAIAAAGLYSGGGFRIVGKRQRPLDWHGPRQGAQEIARRRRQIERGQLNIPNGLSYE